EETFQTMTTQETDFTLFFSHLRRLETDDHQSRFTALFNDADAAGIWLEQWRETKGESGVKADESQALIAAANPIYIPRNHRIEEAIQAGTAGDYAPMHHLIAVLKNPFEQQDGADAYEAAPKPAEVVQQTFCGT
ncbi:MAG: YdiU family protein, partial [Proteobacteria bacterium]|nr:YdiU family protein [Pseudomonadota bacterium]